MSAPAAVFLELGKKVVAVVVDNDERREILDIDFATAVPSSGKSTTSTLLMLFFANTAAGPPIEPR